MTKTQAPTYEELLAASTKAMAHLDYCGWGDAWERSCAEDEGMIDDLKVTLQRATYSPPPAACTPVERAVLDAVRALDLDDFSYLQRHAAFYDAARALQGCEAGDE